VDCVLSLGGWVVLVRDCCACRAVCGGLRSGAALVDVRLDVVPLPPRSSSPTVADCRLGGYPAGRDRWGGERVVGGVLPHINIVADVWGESSIMTGVYERWCSSTARGRGPEPAQDRCAAPHGRLRAPPGPRPRRHV
jgi:hypothetical protein